MRLAELPIFESISKEQTASYIVTIQEKIAPLLLKMLRKLADAKPQRK
jgi:hypothetical protein